ncbi:MAG: YebG family protein [Desulfococcaceae bacterium]
MAVITKFVVVRNGVELDRVFDVRKEAEAYDNMLDAAENLAKLIRESSILNDEKLIGDISVFLAQNAGEVTKILKGVKPLSSSSESSPEDKSAESGQDNNSAENKAGDDTLSSGKKKAPKNRSEKQ